MKKYIFSVLMAAMAVFTFSSCEDVPAPYDMPTKPETPELSTDGTEANPYTVADAKIAATGTNVFVKAFIVGYVPDKALNEAIFGDAASAEKAPTNILVAASADETNVTNCMPIQLPAGAIRTALNLKDNPGNLKQEVILCGNIENYFGATGLKSVAYAKIGAKEFGTKPGDSTTTPDTPAGEAKGTGTEADPFNSVAANNLATSLGSGEVSDKEYYIKGKIQEIKDQFAAQFGNATFYIADDENSQKFLIFRTYYFGGEKWKEGDGQLKIGDEVVVCAKLINYMGNTPETNQGGKLISVNGKTSIEGGSETPDTPSSGDTTTPNGDFETWVDGKPNNWKTASTACNATLTQSTDAHSGKYSVKVGGSTAANKRLGYKEMELKAGTYKIKYYVKAATETGASVQSGFVDITAEGKAGSYVYSGYINDIPNTKWTLVEQELVIPSDGKYCIVIMNAKKPGGDVLIDDLTLTLGETVIIK